MEMDSLERRIARLDAGDASELDAVRAGLQRLERENPLPLAEFVREHAGPIELVEVVEFALQPGDGLLRAALTEEAGEVDLVGDIFAAIAGTLPVREAVRAELAGSVPIADAVRTEAGEVDVVEPVLDEAGLVEPFAVPVAEAVRAGAGPVDVVDDVMALIAEGWISTLLDRELAGAEHTRALEKLSRHATAGMQMTVFADVGRALRAAVSAEAGPGPSLWHGVAAGIGIADPEVVAGYDGALVAAAIRSEAGTVDVTAAVMQRVKQSAVAPVGEVPAPANTRFAWGAMLLAAAAILCVVGANALFGAAGDGFPERSLPVAQLDFASPDEITIDDLEYGENAFVQVITTEGDDAATIIWVEGETL